MSPLNTPPHVTDNDEGNIGDEEYFLEGEPFEIISDHSDVEMDPDDEEDELPTIHSDSDDAKLLLDKHKESVFCVAVHPHGRFVCSGAQDHTAIIWDAVSGEDVFTCTGHEDSVICVAFSPIDGEFLVTGDMAGGLQMWRHQADNDTAQWNPHQNLTIGDLLWAKWWAGDIGGSQQKRGPLVLLAGSADGIVTACLVSSKTKHERPPKFLIGPGGEAIAAEIVPSTYASERPHLAVMYRDGDFRVWDLKTEQVVLTASLVDSPLPEIGDLEGEHAAGVEERGFLCMAAPQPVALPEMRTLDIVAVGSANQIVIIPCRPPAPSEKAGDGVKKVADSALTVIKLESSGTVEAIDFSWTHPFFAFGTVSGHLGVFDTTCMRIRQKWIYTDASFSETDGVGITALRWSQTAPHFFTSTLAGTVVAWAAGSPDNDSAAAPLAILRGHTQAVLDLALSPAIENRHAFVVSASDDATLRLFNLGCLDARM